MKKMMLLALAVASVAMFALPAVASANVWHLEPESGKFPQNFTVNGGEGSLSTTGGSTIRCTSVTSTSGQYQTGTTGTMRLLFHGCTSEGPSTTCTTSGQSSGTITTEPLSVHNVMLPDGNPGILVKSTTARFAHFSCAFGLVTVEVLGNGVLGRITAPKCDTSASSATVDFNATAHGVQEYTTHTGTNYGLTRGGEASAQDTTATVQFTEKGILNCTP